MFICLIKIVKLFACCVVRYNDRQHSVWQCGGIQVIRLPINDAKYIPKSSLFILLPSVIRQLELKPNSEQKVEYILVQPPYCQTECWRFVVCRSMFECKKKSSKKNSSLDFFLVTLASRLMFSVKSDFVSLTVNDYSNKPCWDFCFGYKDFATRLFHFVKHNLNVWTCVYVNYCTDT